MKRLLLAAGAAILTGFSFTATAQTVLPFGNAYGWDAGSQSAEQWGEGLSVSLDVVASPNDGMVYAKGVFCNSGSSGWTGGIRVTDDYPTEAHSMLRVAAGDCRVWGEHLSEGLTTIYVLVDEED